MVSKCDETLYICANKGDIVGREADGPERNRMAWLEQNCVGCIKALMRNFSKWTQVMVNPCVRTLATAYVCTVIPKKRRFIEREVNRVCLRALWLFVVNMVASQFRDEKSDTVTEVVRSLVTFLVRAVVWPAESRQNMV